MPRAWLRSRTRLATRRRSSVKPLLLERPKSLVGGEQVHVRIAGAERPPEDLGLPRLGQELHRRPRRLLAADDEERPEDARLEVRPGVRVAQRNRQLLREVVRVARVEHPDSAAESARFTERPERELGVGPRDDCVRESTAVALPGAEVERLVSEEDVVGPRGAGEPRGRGLAGLYPCRG